LIIAFFWIRISHYTQIWSQGLKVKQIFAYFFSSKFTFYLNLVTRGLLAMGQCRKWQIVVKKFAMRKKILLQINKNNFLCWLFSFKKTSSQLLEQNSWNISIICSNVNLNSTILSQPVSLNFQFSVIFFLYFQCRSSSTHAQLQWSTTINLYGWQNFCVRMIFR